MVASANSRDTWLRPSLALRHYSGVRLHGFTSPFGTAVDAQSPCRTSYVQCDTEYWGGQGGVWNGQLVMRQRPARDGESRPNSPRSVLASVLITPLPPTSSSAIVAAAASCHANGRPSSRAQSPHTPSKPQLPAPCPLSIVHRNRPSSPVPNPPVPSHGEAQRSRAASFLLHGPRSPDPRPRIPVEADRMAGCPPPRARYNHWSSSRFDW